MALYKFFYLLTYLHGGWNLGHFLLFLVSRVLDCHHVEHSLYSGHTWIHLPRYPFSEVELWIFIRQYCWRWPYKHMFSLARMNLKCNSQKCWLWMATIKNSYMKTQESGLCLNQLCAVSCCRCGGTSYWRLLTEELQWRCLMIVRGPCQIAYGVWKPELCQHQHPRREVTILLLL